MLFSWLFADGSHSVSLIYFWEKQKLKNWDMLGITHNDRQTVTIADSDLSPE
jgi:hypothetical protein